VSVEIDEVSQLSVDHPLDQAVSVLEFYAKDGVSVAEWIDAVGDSEFEMIQEDRNSTMFLLVSLDAHLEKKDRENSAGTRRGGGGRSKVRMYASRDPISSLSSTFNGAS